MEHGLALARGALGNRPFVIGFEPGVAKRANKRTVPISSRRHISPNLRWSAAGDDEKLVFFDSLAKGCPGPWVDRPSSRLLCKH